MIPLSASCLILGTRKFLDFVGVEKLSYSHCLLTGKHVHLLYGSYFCSIVLEGNSALLLLLFFLKKILFTTILFWFFKHLLWTYLLCSPCSVGCGHSIRTLLTVAWWISVYPYCPGDSTTFLYVQVTFHEHDQLYNPLRSSASIDVQMELSPLMPLQMDIW